MDSYQPGARRIAFFGGSFNPPHRAHREVLEYLSGLNDFDGIWMVPAFSHPFEKDLAPFKDRLRMAELTAKGLGDKVTVSDIEARLKLPKSYTIDVIRELKKRNPDCRFWIVVGSDCRKELPRWSRYDELKNEAGFFFVPRPGFEESPFSDVSSTRVREALLQGESPSEELIPEVLNYIHAQGLYR